MNASSYNFYLNSYQIILAKHIFNMLKLNSIFKRIVPKIFERSIREIRDQYFRKYNIEKLPSEIYSKELKYYSISFCITCMNRLFHLKKTLETNILDNLEYPNLEFIVVNYNSKDNLDSWMKENMQMYIDKGIVNYYRTDEPEVFHASLAKNLAHRVAKGDILCNLDGDNFTGKDYAFYLNYLFNQHQNSFFQFTKKPFWGTEGRIAFMKTDFFKLGGYDESLLPIGHEDHDLMNRAKAIGLVYKKIQIENFLKYLSNTEIEKAENTGNKNKYYDLENSNRKTSNMNIEKGKYIANLEGMKNFKLFENFNTNPKNI